jgi:tetratricopeptide (TPR) repeat protein
MKLREVLLAKKIPILGFFLIIVFVFGSNTESFAQDSKESDLFDEANKLFSKGQYKEAIIIYDKILNQIPNNLPTLKMKGVANSNLGNHQESLKQFFVVLQKNPDDVLALIGMGVGFGNLGEYHEAKYYFDLALDKKSDSTVIKNYKEFVERVIEKYPYIPTEKPNKNNTNKTKIPDWIKSIARWWSENKINDEEFAKALEFLIQNKIVQVDISSEKESKEIKIPSWIKQNADWWAKGETDDKEFMTGIQYMIENGIIYIEFAESTKKNQNEQEYHLFEKYLREISKNIIEEKRYIEYPNPSEDVIKKFLRDYIKWNFEEEVNTESMNFPDPNYEVIDDSYHIQYKVFVNQQPSGLPLDHVSTLENSLKFWENQDITINNKKAKIDFMITRDKQDANIWITWVVRDLGEGVLGHAHLGKGVVEVALGDYNCDGSFQLYDVSSVERIMTHELGHSIGLPHVVEPENIMFPSMSPKYAYCLLG